MDYKAAIGLEIHVELKTKSKAFCGCSTKFGAAPNTHVCPVCLALPGELPVLNQRVISLAVKAALALNCKISKHSSFDRKNYFYPDLPKAYQITQHNYPLATEGFVEIEDINGTKKVGIKRIHIEEDAGKQNKY